MGSLKLACGHDRPRGLLLVILQQYFHPDSVVGARVSTMLAQDMAEAGWNVVAISSDRTHSGRKCPIKRELVAPGLRVRRAWRFCPVDAKSWYGRVWCAAWMIFAWWWAVIRVKPDVLLIGSDPAFSVAVSLLVRLTCSGVSIVHWCFDLYPEAAIAGGVMAERSLVSRLIRHVMRLSYSACDLVVDSGSCMRARLARYRHGGRSITVCPWALKELDTPGVPDPNVRRELFGDAELCLLYSGNLSWPHCYEEFVALARLLRGDMCSFVFSVYGARVAELQSMLRASDTNIRVIEQVPEDSLLPRLCAADIHLASVRPGWEGCVVPTKAYAGLAVGRPYLYLGPTTGHLSWVVKRFDVGWTLSRENTEEVAGLLAEIAKGRHSLSAMGPRCIDVYKRKIGRCRGSRIFNEEMRRLLL